MTEPLDILHLDDDLVVVSKPPGMLVHRDAWSPREEVVLQTLAYQIDRYLFPVHRLDRNTSGVLAFGCSRTMARALHDNLREPDARKEYLVLTRGETSESFTSDRPLSHNGEPREARTEFRRLACFSRCSLLRARTLTGRRHQIRRHLAHLAHQVIGDTGYGKGRINAWFRAEYGLPRMFLHAQRMVVAHPRTGVPMEIVDPLAADLRYFLGRLPDVDSALIGKL